MVDIPVIARNNFFTPLFDDVNASFKPRVIGIVKDFHFQSLRDRIQPLIIAYNDNPIQPIDYYSVKISPHDIPGTLEKLKSIMVKNDEREPFEYHFLEDQLALFYLEDQRVKPFSVGLHSPVFSLLASVSSDWLPIQPNNDSRKSE